MALYLPISRKVSFNVRKVWSCWLSVGASMRLRHTLGGWRPVAAHNANFVGKVGSATIASAETTHQHQVINTIHNNQSHTNTHNNTHALSTDFGQCIVFRGHGLLLVSIRSALAGRPRRHTSGLDQIPAPLRAVGGPQGLQDRSYVWWWLRRRAQHALYFRIYLLGEKEIQCVRVFNVSLE